LARKRTKKRKGNKNSKRKKSRKLPHRIMMPSQPIAERERVDDGLVSGTFNAS
jgi:hypothetical protein